MADSKITALTAISTVDPAADPLVIVDVSDTSMAASGTTKKATINQLLGASGTATLASATISGDLTVDTSTLKVDSANNRVGVGTATPNWLLTASGSSPEFVMIDSGANGTRLYTKTTNTAVFIGANYSTSSVPINFTLDGGSSNAMTLNSTGLGVGVSPSYKLDVLGSATISGRFKTSGALNALYLEDSGTTAGTLYIGTSGNEFRIVTGSNVALAVDVNRNFAIGPTSVTTTATDGFVYVPVCAGAPTGTPTAKGGRAAFVVDSTNNRFYVYVGGAWKYAALV